VSGCSAGANIGNTDNLAAASYGAYASYLATVAAEAKWSENRIITNSEPAAPTITTSSLPADG